MPKNKSAIATDLTKLDAHVVGPAEYNDAPELTDAELVRADLHEGGKLVRRGRPPSPTRRVPVKVRIDQDVLAGLRATGPGWQTRINEVLRTTLLPGVTMKKVASRSKAGVAMTHAKK